MTLFKLKEAVTINTCKPSPAELKGLTFIKPLRTSRYWEGDSDTGLVLFIGLAVQYGFTAPEIELEVGAEGAEVSYKNDLFKTRVKEKHPRFLNKIKLIQNYMRLC